MTNIKGRIITPGLVPVRYIGTIDGLKLSNIHSKGKLIEIYHGDVLLVDRVTAILLNRKVDFETLEQEEDFDIGITSTLSILPGETFGSQRNIESLSDKQLAILARRHLPKGTKGRKNIISLLVPILVVEQP